MFVEEERLCLLMTIWEKYSKYERDSYEAYLKMYGTLSAMFNQKSSKTGAPYLDSKFQEVIYARCFDGENVDIGNTPHDILSTFGNEKIGIGLKTWLNSKASYQKVMQIKANRNEIEKVQHNPEKLVAKLSEIKNSRMKFDYKRLGLKNEGNIYHYVTRDSGKMTLFETSYPLIDIDSLKPGELTPKSFKFSDSSKDYKYTFADSQIWMCFDSHAKYTYKLDTFDVSIMEDPYKLLKAAFKNLNRENNDKKYLYLPLYSYRSKTVPEKSGLNAWNGLPKSKGSSCLRPEGEAYIPIPKELWKKCPNWVDPSIDMSNYALYKNRTKKSSYSIRLHMPDGNVFPALFAQSDFKALETNPQSILGKWLLNVLGIDHPQRYRYDEPSDHPVTMQLLKKLEIDSVKLWHEDENNKKDVWIDFAPYGSFEKFMNE